jgi:hypothetical protein
MAIDGPIANVMDVDLDDAAISSPAQDAFVERPGEDRRKEREDVEPQQGVP